MVLQKYDRGATVIPEVSEYETMKKMATILAQSGMLPDHINSPQAAFAIIQRGRELSIPPMYALNNIYVVHGKAMCNSELMLALIFRDHGSNAITYKKTDETGCWIIAKRKDGDPFEFSFTREDAERAGVFTDRNKVTWGKYTAAMMRARCISATARAMFADSIGGMYTPEELNIPVDEEGNITDTMPAVRARSVDAPPALNDTTMPDQEPEYAYDPRTNAVVDTTTGEVVQENVPPQAMTRSRIRARQDAALNSLENPDDSSAVFDANVGEFVHPQTGQRADDETDTDERGMTPGTVEQETDEGEAYTSLPLITKTQIQKLWTTARKHKWTTEDVHELIGTRYPEARDPETQAPSVKQLTMEEATELIAYIDVTTGEKAQG